MQLIKDNKSTIISHLALMYIIAWLIAPILAYGIIYRLLFLVALAVIADKTIRIRQKGLTIYLFIFIGIIAYYILLDLTNGNRLTYNFGKYIFILCGGILVPFLYTSSNISRYRYLIFFTFMLCIIFNITSIRGLSSNSNIMRDLAKNSEFAMAYAHRGIGGYGYCYAVLLLIPIALDMLLTKNKEWLEKAFILIFLLTSYYLIFASSYFMAILIALLCLPVHFILRVEDKKKERYLLILVLLLGSLCYWNLESIGMLLTENMQVGSVKRKIEDIVLISRDEASLEEGEFATRQERYLKDLKYFFHSPIWGTFDADNGNHSFILDTFASYGSIIGILLFSSIYHLLKMYRYQETGATRTLFWIAFLLLLFNTLAPSLAVSLFIIAPIYCFDKKESKAHV